MNTNAQKAVLPRLWDDLRRAADDPALARYLLRWVGPALFALLISITIRFYSLAPMAALSQAVANLLVLEVIAFLVLLARGSRFSVPRDVVVLLSMLAAAAVVSVLGSGDAGVSLVRLELYVSVALLATLVYLAYRDQKNLPLEAYFLGIAAVHLPFLLNAILWVSEMEAPSWEGWVRVADFVNVRHFGAFGFLAAASATALGLLSRRFVIPSFLLATAALFGIVLTGTRGAVLSWIAFVALMCCFGHARLRAAMHGLLALGLSAASVWYLDRSGLLPSPNIFRRIANLQLGQESFDASRLELWRLSLEQIMAHPLFGSGPEGYWLSACCFRGYLQAHNFVLQFLMEFGLVGCGIAVLLAARAVKGMGGLAGTVTRVLETPGNITLAGLLAAFLVYAFIDQMLYHLLPLLHFALFAGLFAAGLAHARARNGCANAE